MFFKKLADKTYDKIHDSHTSQQLFGSHYRSTCIKELEDFVGAQFYCLQSLLTENRKLRLWQRCHSSPQ